MRRGRCGKWEETMMLGDHRWKIMPWRRAWTAALSIPLALTAWEICAAAVLPPATAAGEPIPIERLASLQKPVLLASDGHSPLWSPDGRWLLFGRGSNASWFDLWIMGRDGNGARRLAETVGHPSWSPDGRRIAYNRSGGRIYVYDLAKSMEMEVVSRRGDVNGPWWTADGQALVFKGAVYSNDNLNTPYLLDLDDLQVREISTKHNRSEGNPGEVPAPELHQSPGEVAAAFVLMCRDGTRPFSQHVAYADGSLPALGDNYGNAFPGLWAVEPDGSRMARLWPRACTAADLAPDLTRVAVAGPDGIYVGGLMRRAQPWNEKYAVAVQGDAKVAEGDAFVVYAGKINPLNGKIVGFQEKDVKGALRVLAARPGEFLAELVEWTGKPISSGDVAVGEFASSNNVFLEGGRKNAFWSTLGAPLVPSQLDAWEAAPLRGATPSADASSPTEQEAAALVMQYYDERGEFAGTYRMAGIDGLRLVLEGEDRYSCHVRYRYAAVPRDGRGTAESGKDARIFVLQRNGSGWSVSQMGGPGSGRF